MMISSKEQNTTSTEIKIFRPSKQQFKNFNKYIKEIECDTYDLGLLKVIPPNSWTACISGYYDSDKKSSTFVTHPTRQRYVTGNIPGVYELVRFYTKSLSLIDFEIAAQESISPPDGMHEQEFWKHVVSYPHPMYVCFLFLLFSFQNPFFHC